MDTTVRRLLTDHLKRRAWLWVAVGVIQFVTMFGAVAGWMAVTPIFGLMLTASQLGGLTIPIDRTISNLPVSTRQLSILHWWLAFGFLGLAITVVNLVAISMASAAGVRSLGASSIFVLVLSSWGVLGVYLVNGKVFGVLARLQKLLPRPMAVLYGLTLVAMGTVVHIAIIVMMFNKLSLNGGGLIVLLVVGLICALAGLFAYGKTNVVEHPQWTVALPLAAKQGGNSAVTTLRGFLVLAWAHTKPILIGCALLSIGLVGFSRSGTDAGGLLITMSLALPMLTPFLMDRWVSSLRVIRQLPIAPHRIATYFLLIATLPTSVAIVGVALLTRVDALALSPLNNGFLLTMIQPLFLQSLALALTLQLRGRATASLITFALTIAAGVVALFLGRSFWLASVLICPTLFVIGVVWTVIGIGRRDLGHAWRHGEV